MALNTIDMLMPNLMYDTIVIIMHTHTQTHTHTDTHTHTHMRAWEILENYNMQSDLCDLGLLLGIQNKIAEQIYRSTVHIWCATRSTEK